MADPVPSWKSPISTCGSRPRTARCMRSARPTSRSTKASAWGSSASPARARASFPRHHRPALGQRPRHRSVKYRGQEILNIPQPRLNKLRGSKITMIFQDPLTSLTPHMTAGAQIIEALRAIPACARRGREARHRDARTGAHPRGQAPDEAVSARALRRHAPARHDRDGDGVRSRPLDRRRADHRARRHGAGADPGDHARPEGRAEDRHRPGQPRHGSDRRRRRPRRGDAPGRHRRSRPGRRHLLQAAPRPTPGCC